MYEDIDILDIDSIYIDNNLIDIRERYEYMLGNIKNSINIPYNYLYVNPDDYLDISKTYYIYCGSGSRSRKLCIHLNNLGYRTVDLIGGYNRYRNR